MSTSGLRPSARLIVVVVRRRGGCDDPFLHVGYHGDADASVYPAASTLRQDRWTFHRYLRSSTQLLLFILPSAMFCQFTYMPTHVINYVLVCTLHVRVYELVSVSYC